MTDDQAALHQQNIRRALEEMALLQAKMMPVERIVEMVNGQFSTMKDEYALLDQFVRDEALAYKELTGDLEPDPAKYVYFTSRKEAKYDPAVALEKVLDQNRSELLDITDKEAVVRVLLDYLPKDELKELLKLRESVVGKSLIDGSLTGISVTIETHRIPCVKTKLGALLIAGIRTDVSSEDEHGETTNTD